MKTMVYAIRNMERNKRVFLLFIIQMIIVFLILPEALSTAIDLYYGIKRVKVLSQRNAYVLRDSTSDEKIREMFSDYEGSKKKLKELYQVIFHGEWDAYGKVEFGQEFPAGNQLVQIRWVTGSFFDTYHIGIENGSAFQAEQKVSGAVRIVMGYNLMEEFEVGEEYCFSDCFYRDTIKGIITGFLEKGAMYPDDAQPGVYYHTDNLCFICMDDMVRLDMVPLEAFDMVLTGAVIYPNSERQLKAIFDKIKETDLLMLRIQKYDSYLVEYLDYVGAGIMYKIGIAVIILVFSLAGFLSGILILLDRNKKEYAIHLLCGAKKKDLFLNFVFQLLLLMMWPVLVCVSVYRSVTMLLLSVGIAVPVTGIVLSVAFFRMKHLSIPQIIRRNE